MSNLKIIDHTAGVKRAMEHNVEQALEEMGLVAEGYAKANLTEFPRVDTGRLRNSVTHAREKNTELVGSSVEYAPYVEYGTGIYVEDGSGRQTPWAYYDSKGVRHVTHGMKPAHFLKRAVTEHINEYKEIAEDCLRGK